MRQLARFYTRLEALVKRQFHHCLELGLIITCALAAVGVFLPETGFDAVWYHLPVIRAMVSAKSLVYIPDLYQSLNPLWSDIFLAVGWSWGGDTGAKIVAFGFYLALLGLSWWLARRWLTKNWSYLAVILVALIQVVAWQASSAYVDVAKAVWELLAVGCLLKLLEATKTNRSGANWWLVLASLAWGAALATKTFSIVLLPLWGVWLVGLRPHAWQTWLWSLGLVLIIPAPFYGWAWWHAGQPLVALTLHAQKISEIGGQSSLGLYVLHQLAAIWRSPWELLVSRDYINWLVFLMWPRLIYDWSQWWRDRATQMLLSLVVWQWLVWWFLPPLSTRYGLSGFVILMILVVRSLAAWWQTQPNWRWSLAVVISLSLIFHTAIRVGVVWRAWPYLSGHETKSQYLDRFMDGHIDQHLKRWHQLP